jgi:mono/diheme cytochrome c family protein
MVSFARITVTVVVASLALSDGSARAADAPAFPKEALDFFETKVRPVFLDKCYNCHDGSGVKAVKGGFTLNTREGLLKGGESGKPAIVPGKPAESRLIQAVKWADEKFRMPPKQEHRLSAEQVADLEKWVQMGAPDPRTGGAATASAADRAKTHWAFQKPKEPSVPAVRNSGWAKSPIDAFVLARLEQKGLSPAPAADKRTLIRRATFDLTGLPPTPDEVAAFEADTSPDAFAKVVDRLLASPHYGERWGRFWLDVARYADTKGYVFEEERRFPFSYTYRDWVIRALNQDLPYDQFLTQQIAADKLPLGDDKAPLAAMGFLTIGRRFLNNQPDIIDDSIDVVTRGTMALTVQCARCHDHKFDPIPTDDYYSLYGVFASSQEPREQPVIGKAEHTEKYEAFEKELAKRRSAVDDFLKSQHAQLVPKLRTADGIKTYLAAVYEFDHQPEKDRMDERRFGFARELSGFVLGRWRGFLSSKKEAGHDPIFAPWLAFAAIPPAEFPAKAKAVTESVVDKAAADKPIHPLVAEKFAGKPPASITEVAQRYGELLASFDKAQPLPDKQQEALRQVLYGEQTPTNIAITDADKLLKRDTRNTLRDLQKKVEALQANNPDAPPRAMVLVDDSTPRNARVFLRGNPANPGKEVPRQFLSILSPEKREPFRDGSGRLELARAIASPDNPLTARVMVNRVWGWHFGGPLVRTPSDFGLRSDPPTHPELLDYLALRFVENQWSLKKLHRLIMLTATYQQGSDYNAVAQKADPENTLLWRMNRRRLEFEALRDSVLAVSGKLDRTLGGRPADITGDSANPRRTVYGFIDRQNLPGMFRAFDFASPDTHSPQRFTTTVPQQALFMMNSPFVVNTAKSLAARPEVTKEADPARRVETLYRILYGRAPGADELQAAADFLRGEEAFTSPGTPAALTPWEKYAQVLLESNEFVFVD